MADFRSWFTLGRVSNLSTVWSNGLCAWILGGSGNLNTFLGLAGGLSLLYIGGMYLNDYFDVEFDKQFRPERPIPSGNISRSTVLTASLLLFTLGLVLIAWMEIRSLWYAVALLAIIVLYDWVHKHTAFGVPLMAACRTGVYLTVGAATTLGVTPSIWGGGGLIFFYVLGITALARTESTALKTSAAGYSFLVVPMIGILFLAGPPYEKLFPISFCLLALWISITFSRARSSGKLVIGKTIGPLLAGICLIDLAILNSMHLVTVPTLGIFVALFVVAIIAQRFVPAS